MIINNILNSTTYYFKTLIIAIILTLTIIPLLVQISAINMEWIMMAIGLWILGSITIFYPFVKYLYPQLITRSSFFLLTTILIIVSTWLNITLIGLFLPYNYIDNAILDSTLLQLSLFGYLYIMLVNILIAYFVFSPPSIAIYRVETYG